jgi:hypothetical protein
MVIIWRNSREDCIELSRQGIPSGDKTETLDFPDSLSEDDMWLYLRGMYEGDGSISIESNTYPRIGITTSKLWCEKCEQWLNDRDIRAYTVKDGERTFCLTIHSIDSFKKFIDKIYETNRDFRMSRKFSCAMKIKCILEKKDIVKRISFRKKKRQQIMNDIRDCLVKGIPCSQIKSKFKCSGNMVRKAKSDILGTRTEKSRKVIEEIKPLLLSGRGRYDLFKSGYGTKLINRAFFELYGSPKQVKEKFQREKTEKIREMISQGYSVSHISEKTGCGNGRVIKERRLLFEQGHPIKVNTTKNYPKGVRHE